jgi:hypothetical protein
VARFEVSNAKSGVNVANTNMWQLKTAAGSRARIFEISISIAVAPTAAPSWRLVRSATVGTSNATATPEEEDPGGGAATVVLDTGWSTQPTASAADLRRYATPATAGSGIVWTWPDHRPLILPVSSGMLVVNANASGATNLGTFNCCFVFEE